MAKVKIYTKSHCPYCEAAKRLLQAKGVSYEEIDVTDDFDKLAGLAGKTGHQTVPMIFIGEKFVGGFDELEELEHSGKLEQLLDQP